MLLNNITIYYVLPISSALILGTLGRTLLALQYQAQLEVKLQQYHVREVQLL